MAGQRTTRECQHESAGGLARAPTSWRGLGVKKPRGALQKGLLRPSRRELVEGIELTGLGMTFRCAELPRPLNLSQVPLEESCQS
jgi:hypothetical protein